MWPNEGTRMQLAAQLSYQQSLEQPRILDDSPKAEEPNEKSDKTVIKKKKKKPKQWPMMVLRFVS